MYKYRADRVKTTLIITLLLLFPLHVFSGPLSEEKRKIHFNLNSTGVAIQGFDPVSYFDGKATRGKKSIAFMYKGITYLFSSKRNLEVFKQSPGTYEPAYGGWCAWAMREGEKVAINPERFKIVNKRLYLFYDRFFTNTLKKWNKLAEEKTENILIEKADTHWCNLTKE